MFEKLSSGGPLLWVLRHTEDQSVCSLKSVEMGAKHVEAGNTGTKEEEKEGREGWGENREQKEKESEVNR